MFGHPETRQSFGLAQKAGTLLLAILLTLATSAQGAGGVSGGMSSGSMSLGGGSQSAGASQAATPAASSLSDNTALNGSTSTQVDPATAKQMPDAYRVKQPPDASAEQQKNTDEKSNNALQETGKPSVEPRESNEFQDFVAQSVGKVLPMYGYNLFSGATSTFSPVDNIPVTPDYMIGPGDELVINVWGQVDVNNLRLVVNRNGQIEIPKVGSVNVAGIRYQDLQGYLKGVVGDVFRNFDLNVTLGKLRSIQVFVVGQARRPGVYTVSSLSTLVNTLFSSGGPSSKGSMRQIQVKRENKIITTFDLYDLLIKGDKSKDVKLLPGDVIYIPPIGLQVAISGSVNVPAIYEIKDGSNFSDLLALAGGVSNVAATQKASIEQIFDNKMRKVDEIQFDGEGLARKLQNGDVITVSSISQRFDNAVRLQGHVASPVRHVWQKGMRVTDLLGDKDALIPSAYWERQNSGALSGKYSKQEVNWDYAVIQRLDEITLTTKLFSFNLGKAIQGDPVENELLQPGDVVTIFSADDVLPKTENDVALNGSIFVPSKKRFVWRKGMRISNLIPDAKWLISYYDYWLNIGGNKNTGLNWGYANIFRQQPTDLSRTMIAFDLGKVVLEGDSSNNLVLQPGDEVSIFTNSEIQVPVDKKKCYVRLEGELKNGGIYETLPGETLRQLVVRVGGLTPNAYLFGSEFDRESVRQMQQKKLKQMADKMEEAVQRNLSNKSNSALTPEDAVNSKTQAAAQIAQVERMKKTQASGRIVLDMPADSERVKDIPDLSLEDGDSFIVPTKPSVVSVMGMVYNENAFIYRAGKNMGNYLDQAGGPTRDADESRIYLLRADGSVQSAQSSGYFSRGLSGKELMPGDAVIVPELLDKLAFSKELQTWSQIFFQFALGVGGIKMLRL